MVPLSPMNFEQLQVPPTEAEIGEVVRVLMAGGLSPFANIVRRLAFQRAQLRDQSAREHEAWKALQNREVDFNDATVVTGKPLFYVHGPKRDDETWFATYGPVLVDAVLAVAEAMKQTDENKSEGNA